MGLAVDWENELILITSPTTGVNAQVLHDFIEDRMASSVGQSHADIIRPEGKIEDLNNPGVYSQIIVQFNPPWQIQYWGGSGYTRIYGGKIVGGLNGQPMKATGTAGDITVLESPVDGLATLKESGVSGLTAPESAALIGSYNNTVDLVTRLTVARAAALDDIDTLLVDLTRALGLLNENAVQDQIVYNGNGNVETMRVRIYNSKDNAVTGGATGLIATYAVIATYAANEMTYYRMTLQ